MCVYMCTPTHLHTHEHFNHHHPHFGTRASGKRLSNRHFLTATANLYFVTHLSLIPSTLQDL